MRRISSSATYFYQFVFAPIWIIGFGSGAFSVLANPDVDPPHLKAVFPIAWLFGTALCLTVFRYAVVDISESHLRVTRLWKTENLSWTAISGFGGSTVISPETVTIHFNSPNQFGRSVSFLPKQRFFRIHSPHPIREELQRILDKARQGAT